MAESTLATTYTDLKLAVAHYLGYGVVSGSWSAKQIIEIDMAVKSGLRQFYFPPKIEDKQSHKWSFLEPVVEMDTVAPYDTGTINVGRYATGTVTVDTETCTLTDGIWPTWTLAGDTFTIDSVEYTITTRDGDRQLTVVGDDVTDKTYTLVTQDTTNAKAIVAGGTWPAWAATHGSIVIDGTEYTISARDGDQELTLSSAWALADYIEGEDYTLRYDGDYDLPDAYAGMIGEMVIESDNYRDNVVIVGEGRLRTLRQQLPQSSASSSPFYGAIRPKQHETTTVGQRFELMLYPEANDVYTISYGMRLLPEMLSATTDPLISYPYGGATHAETLRASCMAAAEVLVLNGHGPLWDAFKEALTSSITSDNAMNSVQSFGYNGDNSDAAHRPNPNRRSRNYNNRGLVTYTP